MWDFDSLTFILLGQSFQVQIASEQENIKSMKLKRVFKTMIFILSNNFYIEMCQSGLLVILHEVNLLAIVILLLR